MRWVAVWVAWIASGCLSADQGKGDGDRDGGGDPFDAAADPGGDGAADAAALGECNGRPIAGLVDTFADDLGPVWETVGGEGCAVSAGDGVLKFSTDGGGLCGVQTLFAYEFLDAAVTMRIAASNPNSTGKPDIAFRMTITGWAAQLQYRDGSLVGSNCPDGANCGTTSSSTALRPYWRIRHDGAANALVLGVSDNGDVWDELAPLDLGDGADATCGVVFIGTRGDTVALPETHIDGVNVE